MRTFPQEQSCGPFPRRNFDSVQPWKTEIDRSIGSSDETFETSVWASTLINDLFWNQIKFRCIWLDNSSESKVAV